MRTRLSCCIYIIFFENGGICSWLPVKLYLKTKNILYYIPHQAPNAFNKAHVWGLLGPSHPHPNHFLRAWGFGPLRFDFFGGDMGPTGPMGPVAWDKISHRFIQEFRRFNEDDFLLGSRRSSLQKKGWPTNRLTIRFKKLCICYLKKKTSKYQSKRFSWMSTNHPKIHTYTWCS